MTHQTDQQRQDEQRTGSDPVVCIRCPNLGCQRVLGIPESHRGLVVRCRGCRTLLKVPVVRSERTSALMQAS